MTIPSFIAFCCIARSKACMATLSLGLFSILSIITKHPFELLLCLCLWQGWQFWNQTFDEELEKVDVTEIRELFDESEEAL